MSKHTPGPWTYTKNKDYKNSSSGVDGFLVLQASTSAKNIATIVPCMGMTKEEVEANAEVIARAPYNQELAYELNDRINACRNYLMGVDPKKITVEDTLLALGFNRNGLMDRLK